MELTVDRDEGMLTVQVEGRLDGSTVTRFEEVIVAEMDDGERAVLLDCEKLSYMGSTGIRAVLILAKALSSRNAGFALCSLSEPVREVFRISGFDRIVAIYPSRTEALAAFES